VKKYFWIFAGLGVLLYLYSKREVKATITTGEPTISYAGKEPLPYDENNGGYNF